MILVVHVFSITVSTNIGNLDRHIDEADVSVCEYM